MTELAQSNDPKALVPGDPQAIHKTASLLRTYGNALHLAGEGLRRIDTSAGWGGAAADAFRNVFHGQPGKWLQAGDAFHNAAAALDSYASTLSWAQEQAVLAINLWNSAETNHPAAQATLANARSQLEDAGNVAAATVGKARDLAPPKPSFWSRLGSDVGSFFTGALHGVEHAGETVLGGAASVGNAMIHHPGSVAEILGGTMLAGISAGGEIGGVALDATGVGAVLGVPANVVSAAGITAGVGLAGTGLTSLMNDAAGPDRVNMSADSGGAGGGSGGVPRSYSSNAGNIANKTGYSRKQILDAIHAVKNQPGWRDYAGARNPDVIVDSSTGEVYPQLPDGSPGDDSIGNIFDYLPEEP